MSRASAVSRRDGPDAFAGDDRPVMRRGRRQRADRVRRAGGRFGSVPGAGAHAAAGAAQRTLADVVAGLRRAEPPIRPIRITCAACLPEPLHQFSRARRCRGRASCSRKASGLSTVLPVHVGRCLVDVEDARDDLARDLPLADVLVGDVAVRRIVLGGDLPKPDGTAIVHRDGNDVAFHVESCGSPRRGGTKSA